MSNPPNHISQEGKLRKKYKIPQSPLWGAFFLRLPEGLRRAPFEGGWWVLFTDNSMMNYELFCLLQSEGLGALVTHLTGAPILDRSRIDVAGVLSPFLTLAGEELEGSSV